MSTPARAPSLGSFTFTEWCDWDEFQARPGSVMATVLKSNQPFAVIGRSEAEIALVILPLAEYERLTALDTGDGPGPAASPANLPPMPPPATGSVSASATNPATLATPDRPGP